MLEQMTLRAPSPSNPMLCGQRLFVEDFRPRFRGHTEMVLCIEGEYCVTTCRSLIRSGVALFWEDSRAVEASSSALLAAVSLVRKHLDVVANCGGDDAEHAGTYEENGEPEEPRLVEGEKHGYRLSGTRAKARLHGNSGTFWAVK